MSSLQGGKFGHGFASAGVTQAFSGAIDSIGGDAKTAQYWESGNITARATAAAVIGGTASELSGGKFANGAMTAVFSRLFNHEYHKYQEYGEYLKNQEMARYWRSISKFIDNLDRTEVVGEGKVALIGGGYSMNLLDIYDVNNIAGVDVAGNSGAQVGMALLPGYEVNGGVDFRVFDHINNWKTAYR